MFRYFGYKLERQDSTKKNKYFRETETQNFGGREFCGDSAFVEIGKLERYFQAMFMF